MQARRLVAFAPLSMEVETVNLPDAAPPDKMLVETHTTAVSAGTEVANYRGITTYRSAANPDWRTDPYYPGYSLAGVVRAVGKDVTQFKVGDRVCGMGPHASAVMVDPDQFVQIPDTVSCEYGAMTTVVCIVMNAVRLAKMELGERVAVVGAGLIGQLALQLSRLAGARPTVCIDPITRRRDLALICGATAGIDPTSPDAAEQLARATCDERFSVVFEATGSPAAFNPALKVLADGGRMVLLGSTRGLVDDFDPYADVHVKGVTLIGAHMRTHPVLASPYNPWTWTRNRRLGLQLIADGSLRLEPLISHRVPGDEGPALYARLSDSRETFLCVLLDWSRKTTASTI